jgi:hypothetical protein
MKRFGIVCLALCLLISLSLLAAPSTSSAWGTISRTNAIGTLVEVMATSGEHTAPGLAVALNRHAQKAAQDIAALYAVDTTTLTTAEYQEYVAALTGLNQVMRDAFAVLRDKGFRDEANAYADCTNALITYADHQGTIDPVFGGVVMNAPSTSTTWGTVSVIGKLP